MKVFSVLVLLAGTFLFTTACNSGDSGSSSDKDTTLVEIDVQVSDETAAQVDSFLQTYYAVKDKLVDDDSAAAKRLSEDLLAALNNISLETISDSLQRNTVSQEVLNLKNLIPQLNKDTSIAAVRATFENISYGTYSLIKSAGLKNIKVYRTYCPMADAYWLSASDQIMNPYYGHSMINCGMVKETLEF